MPTSVKLCVSSCAVLNTFGLKINLYNDFFLKIFAVATPPNAQIS